MKKRYIKLNNLTVFCRQIFQSYGFSTEQSEQLTQVLLTADCFGNESHGVQR